MSMVMFLALILFSLREELKYLICIMTHSDKGLNQSTGQMEESIQDSMDPKTHQQPKNQEGELKLEVDLDRLGDVMKQYKKLKKYMRSPLYEVKRIDGTEKVISKLLEE